MRTPSVGTAANGSTNVTLLDLVNPNFGSASGAGVLSIDRSSSQAAGVTVIALAGAHTDAPIVVAQNGASVADPAPLAIDPEPNSVIFDFVSGANDTFAMTFNETEIADQAYSAVGRMGAAYKTVTSGAATTVDVSFVLSAQRYAQLAAAYKVA